jgi:hypothetical protein
MPTVLICVVNEEVLTTVESTLIPPEAEEIPPPVTTWTESVLFADKVSSAGESVTRGDGAVCPDCLGSCSSLGPKRQSTRDC